MKGIKQYTQHSVAFPMLTIHGSSPAVYDDINIGWNAKDGGTYGELKIEFYRFKGSLDAFGRTSDTDACAIHCFSDAMKLLATPELRELTRWISRRRKPVTPNDVIEKLESLGFKPSPYHLRAA